MKTLMQSWMGALSLLLVGAVATARPSDARPPMTEVMAIGGRAAHGITILEKIDEYNKYDFRGSGTFLISNQLFPNAVAARRFCESIPGYRLTSGMLHSVLTMMGLPFVELYETAIVSQPVLSKDGGRTGVAFWMWPDMSKAPPREQMTARDIMTLEMFHAGDIFGADLDGMEGEGSGMQILSVINRRLRAAGQRPLLLRALCEDGQISESLR